MKETMRQVWRWWVAQMLALGGRARTAGGPPDGLVLDVSDGPEAARLLRRGGGRMEPLGPVRLAPEGAAALRRAAGDAALSLRVPADWMLQHDAALPLAAEAVLPDVMRHELGRLTPFTEAEVLWDHAVLGRDAGRGRLLVRLVLALRAPLDPLLLLLSEAGVRATRVEPAGPGDALRLRLPGGRRLARALGGLCAVLAVLVLAVPVARQSLALGRVERRMAALRPAVERSSAIHRRLNLDAADGDAMAANAARTGRLLTVLVQLTNLLPDGTFLTALTLKGDALTIDGRSDHAVGLIAILSANPDLHDVEFAAPFTHAASGGDAFVVRAQLGSASIKVGSILKHQPKPNTDSIPDDALTTRE